MIVISARNVNDAWAQALDVIQREGRREESRAGPVLVVQEPVTTVYDRPCERVLLDPVRDANPFFHLGEALWMLAGRDDATWLDQFVGDYSRRFGEPDGRQHGAYGRRWRGWFRHADPEASEPIDQLDEAVRLLRADPHDRQAVLSMWDPTADLGVPGLLDRPCNTHIYLRVRKVPSAAEPVEGAPFYNSIAALPHRVLDITVCCRSNDIVWGCYGANAVHMSVLQEYLAARIGVGVGTYTQVSNNWHMYEATAHLAVRCGVPAARQASYPGTKPLVADGESFDAELGRLLPDLTVGGERVNYAAELANGFLAHTVVPLMAANDARRRGQFHAAHYIAESIAAPDWRLAATAWLRRRIAHRQED